jgi:hypothetical protein
MLPVGKRLYTNLPCTSFVFCRFFSGTSYILEALSSVGLNMSQSHAREIVTNTTQVIRQLLHVSNSNALLPQQELLSSYICQPCAISLKEFINRFNL